jgi:hypothetical protein
LKLDATPFETIFAFRTSGALPRSEREANELFAAYMFQIEQVVEAVDQLERKGN